MTTTNTFAFGTGSVICQSTGNPPIKVGTLQDIEIDISSTNATLYGQNQFPDAIARGKQTLTGKAKTGKIDLNLFSNLYLGTAIDTSGYEKLIEAEAAAVPGSSTYTVQVTNHTSFIADMGVYYAATGIQLKPVAASSEVTGKYSVNATTGTYTFAAGDASAALLFSYSFLGTGSQLLVTNQIMGVNPVFQLLLQNGFTSSGGRTNLSMRLYSCVSKKISFPFKNSDFVVSDFEFDAFADTSTGNVYKLGVGV